MAVDEQNIDHMVQDAGVSALSDKELMDKLQEVQDSIKDSHGQASSASVSDLNAVMKERIVRNTMAFDTEDRQLRDGYRGLDYGSEGYDAQEGKYDAFLLQQEAASADLRLELYAYDKAGLVEPGTAVMAENHLGYLSQSAEMQEQIGSDKTGGMKAKLYALETSIGAGQGNDEWEIQKGPYGDSFVDVLDQTDRLCANAEMLGIQAVRMDVARMHTAQISGAMEMDSDGMAEDAMKSVQSRVKAVLSDVPGSDAMTRNGVDPWVAGDVVNNKKDAEAIAGDMDSAQGLSDAARALSDSSRANSALLMHGMQLHELAVKEQAQSGQSMQRQMPLGYPKAPEPQPDYGQEQGMEF